MMVRLHRSFLGLAVVLLAWGLTSWAASDDPCQRGFDECAAGWTTMQAVAHGLIPVLFLAALVWFVVALVRTVKAIDNRNI